MDGEKEARQYGDGHGMLEKSSDEKSEVRKWLVRQFQQ